MKLIEVTFVFNDEEEDSVDIKTLKDWAKDINDQDACHWIGYEGWKIEVIDAD